MTALALTQICAVPAPWPQAIACAGQGREVLPWHGHAHAHRHARVAEARAGASLRRFVGGTGHCGLQDAACILLWMVRGMWGMRTLNRVLVGLGDDVCDCEGF